jgi:hypothetical protein
MRTYLLTSITQAGYTPYSNEESDSDAVTAQPGRKKKKTERKPVMGKKRKRSPSPHTSSSKILSGIEGVHDPEIPQNSVARCDYRIPEFLRIPGIPQNYVARCNYKTPLL